MRRLKFSLYFFISLLSSGSAQNRGYLLAIGGGNRPDLIMHRFIELAGGYHSKIIIIPNASSEPVSTAEEYVKDFQRLGCSNVEYMFIDSGNADKDSNLNQLTDAEAIFFTGGDQNRLTAALLNTALLGRIKDIYKNGGIIGGTSAGSAVISSVMITGDEMFNKDSVNAFSIIKAGNIKIAEGFGFVQNVIIDQHFVRRKRHNRLITAVLENPLLLGIGIDESTACIFNPDSTIQVLGNSVVIFYDASEAENISTDKNSNLAGDNIRMSILKSGDNYNLKTQKVQIK